jgi:hypothetical protein
MIVAFDEKNNMEILIGFAHIIGSIITYLMFGYVLMLMNTWSQDQALKQIAEEVSVTSGIKINVEDLDKEEHAPTLMKFYTEKFSSELFKNKMSDFFGVIRTLWSWQSTIVQFLILTIVIWYTITNSIDNAVYAWLLVGFSIFSWVINVFVTQSCKILTGRSPGEAKAGRKQADEWIKKNSYP